MVSLGRFEKDAERRNIELSCKLSIIIGVSKRIERTSAKEFVKNKCGLLLTGLKRTLIA